MKMEKLLRVGNGLCVCCSAEYTIAGRANQLLIHRNEMTYLPLDSIRKIYSKQ